MAKATAECTCKTCGRTFYRESFHRNRTSANEWEAWAEETFDECTSCWRERIDREHQAENEAAMEKAKGQGLPELSGSPKQVAWATSIRQKLVDEVSEMLEQYRKLNEERSAHIEQLEGKLKEKRIQRFEQTKLLIEKTEAAIKAIVTEHTAASWWIDRRDYSAKRLVVSYLAD